MLIFQAGRKADVLLNASKDIGLTVNIGKTMRVGQ